MIKAIVTIKLPRNPKHDPRNKIVGQCIVSEYCTDVTGSHHSYLAFGTDVEDITKTARTLYGHVTRVEIIG